MANGGVWTQETLPTNELSRLYDTKTHETVKVQRPWEVYTDFLGDNTGILNSAATPIGPWFEVHTNGGISASVADEPNGVLSTALTAVVEAQDAGFTWGDNLSMSVHAGFQVEARVKITAASALTTWAVGFGAIASAWNGVFPGTIANYQLFVFRYTNATDGYHFCQMSGDGTTVRPIGRCIQESGVSFPGSADVATAGQPAPWVSDQRYYVLRIDCSDLMNCKYYIDGIQVFSSVATAALKTHPWGALANTVYAQPVFGVYKTGADASACTAEWDYIKCWGWRQ